MKIFMPIIILLLFMTSCITVQKSGLKTKLPDPFPNQKIEEKGSEHQVNLIFKEYVCYKKSKEGNKFQAGWFVNIDKMIEYKQKNNRLDQSLKYIDLNCKNRHFVTKLPTATNSYNNIFKTTIITFIVTAIITGSTTYLIMK